MKTAVLKPAAAAALEAALARETLERVILVDGEDRAIGSMGKLEVHRGGNLHRAFSILVYDQFGRLLLQRRAPDKYHFAGRWSNTCCGHPRPGEPTAAAAQRRLVEEFGFSVPLCGDGTFIYRAQDEASGLVEHEYLHVYRGVFRCAPRPDPGEIGAWRWMSVPQIGRALARFPDRFTPWFAMLFERMSIRR